jgi:agmatine/peptidylarginine deiminase
MRRKLLGGFLGLVLLTGGLSWWLGPETASPVRLPADFEPQAALVVSASGLVLIAPDTFADLVAATQNHIRLLALVNDPADAEAARRVLFQWGLSDNSVEFVEVPHDTIWLRDTGPCILESREGGFLAIDHISDRPGHKRDDALPQNLAHLLGLPCQSQPFRFEGGNIVSNGQGLCLTTDQLVTANQDMGLDRDDVRECLLAHYGFDQVVFLEPLHGERTGHADMFSVFVSPATVVVGALDPGADPVNAALLDRNARRLSEVKLPGNRPLQVVRIPMPRPLGSLFPTYTNVVFANDLLIVPTYSSADSRLQQEAFQTFARLLPNRRIVGIEADALAARRGSLHCVTLHIVPALAPSVWRVGLISNERGGRLQFEAPAQMRRNSPGRCSQT